MKQNEFLQILEKNLQGFSIDEKKEILYDYEEHFILGRENGKTDDEIIKELGNPLDIATQYKTNRITVINQKENNNYTKSGDAQRANNKNYKEDNESQRGNNNYYNENNDAQRANNNNSNKGNNTERHNNHNHYYNNNNDGSQYSYTPNRLPRLLLFIILIPFVILPSIGILLGFYGTILGLFVASVAIAIAGFGLSLAGLLGTTILGIEIISLPNIAMIPLPAILFAGVGTIALGGLFFIGTLCLMKFLNLGTSKFFSLISSLIRR